MIALSSVLIAILVILGLAYLFTKLIILAALFAVSGLALAATYGALPPAIPIIGLVLVIIVGLLMLLHKIGSGGKVLATLAIGGLLLACVSGAVGFNHSTSAVASDSSSDGLSEEARKALAKSLTVKTTSANAVCVTDEYDLVSPKIGALESVPDPRKWSDALSTPFSATEVEAIRDELQKTICEDPLLGVSYLTFFATDIRDALKASTGVDIVTINPWLEPYAAGPEQINTTAAGFIPLLDAVEPTSSEIDVAMTKNREWQKEASFANTLLDRFALVGIEARPSVQNYHLAIGGLAVGTLPAVERNDKQESLPALIFSLTEKDQCEELLVIGANTGDKRPELFEPKSCEVTPPPAEGGTPPGETPPQDTPPGFTPPVVNPPTDNPPPVNPPPVNPPKNTPKDPSQDPYVKGNAPDGGGKNVDPGPGPYVPPTQMEQPPAKPYVPPAPPAPKPPAPSPAPKPVPVPTPDPKPAPPPEAPAPPPSAPETGCIPIPGIEDCS